MNDIVDKETRSRMMSGIRSKDTVPEIVIRRGLFAQGFRYKLHDKTLPGKPDIVFPKYKSVIFVNGCFWHGHNCHLFKWPKTRKEFWRKKILGNKNVDKRNYKKLKNEGWYIITVWECALKGKTRKPMKKVIERITKWLICGKKDSEIKGY